MNTMNVNLSFPLLRKQAFFCLSLLLLFLFGATSIQAKKLEDFANVTNDNGVLEVRTSNLVVGETLDPIKNQIIAIRDGGGLSFGNNANVEIGNPLLDGSGDIVLNSLGVPIMKSRMMIFEEHNAYNRENDNFNKPSSRFKGSANVKWYGVDFYKKGNNRNDFGVGGTGSVEFYNCRFVFGPSGTYQFNHFFGNPNIKVNGLFIDHRMNGAACEFAVRPTHPIRNLEIVDHNPSSTERHLVILRGALSSSSPFELFQLKVRNVALFLAANNEACHLINSKKEIYKARENNGILRGYRDFRISVLDADTKQPAKDMMFYIQRKASVGGSYSNRSSIGSDGRDTLRLLQFEQMPGQSLATFNDRSQYEFVVFAYHKQAVVGSHTVAFSLADGTNELLNLLAFDDNNISENDPTKVAVYGTIDNLDQLYDRAKYWKTQAGNTTTPSLAGLLVTGQGQQLTLAPDWNLKLDKNLSSAFAVDKTAQTITIKTNKLLSGTNFKKLQATTGTISVQNDELVDCPHTDKNRNSYVRIIGLDATDLVSVQDAGGTELLKSKGGEFGFAYQTTNAQYRLVLSINDGTEAMRLYNLNHSGIDNTFTIDFVTSDNSFKNTDRQELFHISGNTSDKIEGRDAQLKALLDWVRMLQKQLNTK